MPISQIISSTKEISKRILKGDNIILLLSDSNLKLEINLSDWNTNMLQATIIKII